MSYKFYKFCQAPSITFPSAIFAMYYTLSISGDLPWWIGLLISIAATFAGIIPPLGIIHPLTYGVFIIIALVRTFLYSSYFFWVFLPLLILHIIRNTVIAVFAMSDPQKSLEYDTSIRAGL